MNSGAHLGHSSNEWFPYNAPFIFGERNGGHVIDLNHMYAQYRRSLKFVFDVLRSGGSVCFVATDPDIARILAASLGGLPGKISFLTRWFPGTLTNWSSIFDFVTRAKNNPELVSYKKNPKNHRRWQALKGLQNLTDKPDSLFKYIRS